MRTGFIKEKKCKRCGKIELARFIKDELCVDCYYNVDRFSENREKIKWKDKWQKLKEWLNDRMKHYDDCLNENVIISLERQEVLSARYNQCFEIIGQMQELEKEDE